MATLQDPGTYKLTLEVPPEMMRMLQQMAKDSNQPMELVVNKAIALYKAALDATARGKHVGFVGSDESLEVEFTGLYGSEGKSA
jgi:hypothetical protein